MEVALWILGALAALVAIRQGVFLVQAYRVHRRNPHLREISPHRDRAWALGQ